MSTGERSRERIRVRRRWGGGGWNGVGWGAVGRVAPRSQGSRGVSRVGSEVCGAGSRVKSGVTNCSGEKTGE